MWAYLGRGHDQLGRGHRDVDDGAPRPRLLPAHHAALHPGVQAASDDHAPHARVAREPVVVVRGAAGTGACVDVGLELSATGSGGKCESPGSPATGSHRPRPCSRRACGDLGRRDRGRPSTAGSTSTRAPPPCMPRVGSHPGTCYYHIPTGPRSAWSCSWRRRRSSAPHRERVDGDSRVDRLAVVDVDPRGGVLAAIRPDHRRHPHGDAIRREVAAVRMVPQRSRGRERVDPLDPEEVVLMGEPPGTPGNLIGSSPPTWSSLQVVSRFPSRLGTRRPRRAGGYDGSCSDRRCREDSERFATTPHDDLDSRLDGRPRLPSCLVTHQYIFQKPSPVSLRVALLPLAA